MVEPLACVLRGAARVPAGRVLIVGNGFVGRLFGLVLARRGDEVFAVDADPRRAGRAPDGPVASVVLAGRGGVDTALRFVEAGGTVLVFADAGTIPAADVYRGELTVVGTRSAAPPYMSEAVALLHDLEVPEPTVLPLERFADGLGLFRRRDALKVVFTP
jgi:threonine dehydrogenase-like Zn-dependent dehydrogenase